jgi:hypothetical protein
MTQKDMMKRMDEIEIQLDALDGEIDRSERIWDSLKDYCVDAPASCRCGSLGHMTNKRR